MKPIQKTSIAIVAINLGIWTYGHWNKLSASIFVIGATSILLAYVIVYYVLKACMESYAKGLLEQTVSYLREHYRLPQIEFSPDFFENITVQFASYLLIGVLLLDSLTLYKFHFSVLSVVNLFIANGTGQ